MSQPFSSEFLTSYLDGRLSGEDLVRAEKLMSENESFRAQVNYWQSIRRDLQQLPRPDLGSQFYLQVMKSIDSVAPTSAPSVPRNHTRSSSRRTTTQINPYRWQRWAAVAASLAALILVSLFLAPRMFSRSGDLAMNAASSENQQERSESLDDDSLRSGTEADSIDTRIDDLAADASESIEPRGQESASMPTRQPRDSNQSNKTTSPTDIAAGNNLTGNTASARSTGDAAPSFRAAPTDSIGGSLPQAGLSKERPKNQNAPPGAAFSADAADFAETAEQANFESLSDGTLKDTERGKEMADRSLPPSPTSGRFSFNGNSINLEVDEAWLIEIQTSGPAREQIALALSQYHLQSVPPADNDTQKFSQPSSGQLEFFLTTVTVDELDRTLSELAQLAPVVPVDPTPLASPSAEHETESPKKKDNNNSKSQADPIIASREPAPAAGPERNPATPRQNSANQLNAMAGRYDTQDPPSASFRDRRNIAYLGKQNLDVQFQNGQFNLINTDQWELESREGQPLSPQPSAKAAGASQDQRDAPAQSTRSGSELQQSRELAKNEFEKRSEGASGGIDSQRTFGATGDSGGGAGGRVGSAGLEMEAVGPSSNRQPPMTVQPGNAASADSQSGFETLLRHRRAITQRTDPAADKLAQPQMLNALIVIKFTEENPALTSPTSPTTPSRAKTESANDKK